MSFARYIKFKKLSYWLADSKEPNQIYNREGTLVEKAESNFVELEMGNEIVLLNKHVLEEIKLELMDK